MRFSLFAGAMQLYEKFLRDVWENHDDEDNEMMSDEPSPPPAYDPMYRRPPAPLPFQSTNRSSDRSRFVETQEIWPSTACSLSAFSRQILFLWKKRV